MSNETAIEILNELLGYESQSILPHLGESGVFVSWASADERRIVNRMMDEKTEHLAWLVETIHNLGGEALPVRGGISSTTIHYLELNHLLPKVLEDRKRILSAYESAASQVGSNPLAGEVIGKIITRQRRHIEQLTQMTGKVALTAT